MDWGRSHERNQSEARLLLSSLVHNPTLILESGLPVRTFDRRGGGFGAVRVRFLPR